MADIDDTQINDEEVVDDPSLEEAPEETQEELETEEEQVAEEVEEQEEQIEEISEEQPEKPTSRRADLRIQKLIEKLKTQDKPSIPQAQGINYQDELDADPEVIAKLDADRQTYGDSLYQNGLDQANAIQFNTRLEIDAPRVLEKYPQLNPEDNSFNPALADAINNWYLSTVGWNPEKQTVSNPNIRYQEFAESIFELGNEIAGQKVQATAKNIAKQAATTGLRPDGSSSKRMNLNQPIENMSDEELAAYGKTLGLSTKKHR